MIDIIELTKIKDWEKLKSESMKKKEIIIFKYSPTCSVSFSANYTLDNWLSGLKNNNNLLVARVNVIENREVSNKIETGTGILHESPQILWLTNDGKVKWHGSHFEITVPNLNRQLSSS